MIATAANLKSPVTINTLTPALRITSIVEGTSSHGGSHIPMSPTSVRLCRSLYSASSISEGGRDGLNRGSGL